MRSKDMMRFIIASYNHFEAHPAQTHYSDFGDTACERIKYLALNNHWYFGIDNIVIYDGMIHAGTWDKKTIKAIIGGEFSEVSNAQNP